MPDVTCIIPTFKRPRTLLQALRSLQQQTLPEFEILVVDNAADLTIEHLVTEFNQTARIPARYIPEPRLGLHYVRHTAIHATTNELLILTDDDATFDPNWLQEHANAFATHPDMAAAGGPVRPVWEVPPPAWVTEAIQDVVKATILSLMDPSPDSYFDHAAFFFGVNMAIRRKILFDVNGFNPDSFGDIWLGDGESGLLHKLWDRHLLLGYVATAIVYHHIPPERMTLAYFRQRLANQGACDMYTLYHKGIPGRKSLLKSACRIMLNNRFWLKAITAWGRTDMRSLEIQLQATRTLAQVKYIARLLADKDFRALVLKDNWLESPNT